MLNNNHFKMKRLFLLTFISLLLPTHSQAQCTFKNTAFKSGEFLSYNLYYNWKFIWVKAGIASMSTVQTHYEGKPAYRASLITRGNNKVDEMFVLRDTLLCYSSTDLAPLYYRKGAREGKRYYVDEIFYSYENGKCNVKQHSQHNDGTHTWQKHSYDDCIYDMINMFIRARSFDPTNWKKGYTVDFPIADGDSRKPAKIKYQGKTVVKADNGKKYRCLQLSYLELDDDKYKRIVDFYVTDDENHIPIRLDMFLRFGSAKAFLIGMKGERNPITSIVE
ncbi:MAG: DUF3108 domain-containing protein [Prevotella sp.]|nr:DUF3108 domain-containing protein [Prevotella sp.]